MNDIIKKNSNISLTELKDSIVNNILSRNVKNMTLSNGVVIELGYIRLNGDSDSKRYIQATSICDSIVTTLIDEGLLKGLQFSSFINIADFFIMNINTRKYIRVLDAQLKIYKQIVRLNCSGDNWKRNQLKMESLKTKLNEYETKLNNLVPLIKETEFNEHLSDRMCCTWEDFKNI